MRKINFTKHMFMIATGFVFILTGCSDNESVETEPQEEDYTEVIRSSEIDSASESMDDIAIDAYEAQEASDNTTGRITGVESYDLPDCVTKTIIAEENSRLITIDFGTEGCEVRGHVLKGQIVLSYTRDPEAQEILITRTLEDFYFDDKQILGTKSILKQRSNTNGNPQFTKTTNITVIWSDGAEASRTGTKVREWIEGHGSGIWSDNVFEVTGQWSSTFKNGNTHSYSIVSPLRREVICRYFVSGSLDVERTNFSGVFDYGEGDCDNQATFTNDNGEVRDIVLN